MDISKLDNKKFAVVFNGLMRKVHEDPINNFIKAKGFMDFNPTPAQTVALKVIFNKDLDAETMHDIYMEKSLPNGDFNLIKVRMTEVQLYEHMTDREYKGKENYEEKTIVNMIDLIVGRRGGKTTLSGMLAIYCAISTNWKPYLKKTPSAHVLILSHSRDFSDEVLDLIRTLIQDSPILSRLINNKAKNTASTMNLRVPWIVEGGAIEYSRVQIKVGAASKKTTRGTAACAVLCDEIAFWNLDENLKETDAEIIKAVRPNMKQFGSKAIMIKLSSPGIRQGVLYNEFNKWRDGSLPSNYVVFKAPSWVWNTILPKEEFFIEWKLDPDGFDTEYRANFVDSLSNFILPEFVDMAVIRGCDFQAPHEDPGKVMYSAAIDAAYKSDAFTFSVVGHVGNRLVQYISKGWKGSKEKPVRSSDVALYIRQICKQYDIPVVAADQYSFQPLREIFEQYGVTLEEYTFSPKFKKQIYFNLKKLVHSQQIDLLDNDTQTKEIKELIVEKAPSGNIKIGHPSGGSDDYADSLAIASYLATKKAGGNLTKADFAATVKDYGIKVDQDGNAFTAPSPEMIGNDPRFSEYAMVADNSEEYVKHPETGKLVRRDELDDDPDDGTHFAF